MSVLDRLECVGTVLGATPGKIAIIGVALEFSIGRNYYQRCPETRGAWQ